jgi:4-amino-4-deoxy-L-arabinose transferase-like glycosyltransferase
MLRALAALLTTALALFAGVLRSPPPWTLDVGAPGDERFLQDWYAPERGDGLTFRWSRPGSRLVLHGANVEPLVLVLRVNPGTVARRVRLVSRDQTMNTFEAVPGWSEYRIPISLRDRPGTFSAPPAVELACDRYLSAHDDRSLGLMINWVRLEPDSKPTAGWKAPLWRALELTSVLIVFAAVLVRVTARGPDRSRVRNGLVLAPVALAAVALATATYRNPYLTAWAVPMMPWTLGLLCLGLLITRLDRSAKSRELLGEVAPPGPWALAPLLILLALVLAGAMRFVEIKDLPWALWRDEARHGLIALRILEDDTYRPIYIGEHHVNLPALGLYPFAAALGILGVHTWSLRVVTAMAGALTVLPLYGLALRLTRRRDVALLASALLAISSWHVSISRFSFPAVFDPLLTLTGLWLLLRAANAARPVARGASAAAAGMTLGLALQTYHSARVAPLLAALLVAVQGRSAWRASILLPLLLAFGVVVSPLCLYAVQNPGALGDRVGEVFLLRHAERNGEAPLGALDESLGRHLLMFNWKGDDNGRHHAPGRPLLDWVTGLGFLAGLAVLLKHRRSGPSRFMIGALSVAILPSLLAVDGPHAMRSIGAVAFACLIAAFGWLEIARSTPWPRTAAISALALALGLNAMTYFVTMPRDPRVWGSSHPVQTQLGAYVRGLVDRGGARAVDQIFVSEEVGESDVFQYLTHGTEPATFAAGMLSRHPRPGDLFLLSGYSYAEESRALAPYMGPNPSPVLLGPVFPGQTAPSFVGYRVPDP